VQSDWHDRRACDERSLDAKSLLYGEGLGYVFGVGAGLDKVLGDSCALVGGEGGDGGEDAAKGDGDVVDVVHEADGFSGEGHFGSILDGAKLSVSIVREGAVRGSGDPHYSRSGDRRYPRRLLGRGADGGGLAFAVENRVGCAGAVVEDDQADRGAHEDDGGPGGEAREHVGGGAGSEGGLRALTAEGAGEVGGTALLDENNTDQEETHDQVNDNENIEENLHC